MSEIISDIESSFSEFNGMNLWFLSTVVYVKGKEILSKSCIPIDDFFLFLPIPK